MAFPEMKVYCPPQPTRLVNNGTFTKNPKPTAPTFIPLPVPLYAKTAAKIHPNNPPFSSLKPSNCLLTVFTPLKPSNSTLRGKNSPNALSGNCMYTIKLQSSFLTFLIIIKSFKHFTRHTRALKDCLFAVWLKTVLDQLHYVYPR